MGEKNRAADVATPAGAPAKPTEETRLRKQNYDRIRMVHDELDRLGVDAAERTQSMATKASFLAVSAGVIIAAVTAQVWGHLVWFGIVALSLACLALICAAVALRPGRRAGLPARRIADKYINSTSSVEMIAPALAEEKATILAAREDGLRQQAIWVWIGFICLGAASLSLTVVFTAELLGA
ncbi:hypothetical protein [Microbacterium sp. NPDC055599]